MQLESEEMCSFTGEVAHRRKVEHVLYVDLHQGSEHNEQQGEAAPKMMIDTQQLQQLQGLDLYVQQLQRGSRWTFSGHMSVTKKRSVACCSLAFASCWNR